MEQKTYRMEIPKDKAEKIQQAIDSYYEQLKVSGIDISNENIPDETFIQEFDDLIVRVKVVKGTSDHPHPRVDIGFFESQDHLNAVGDSLVGYEGFDYEKLCGTLSFDLDSGWEEEMLSALENPESPWFGKTFEEWFDSEEGKAVTEKYDNLPETVLEIVAV